jgi:hypothetical protein
MRTDRRKDGRADMTNLIVAFRNFANTPKTDCTFKFFKFHALILQVSETAEVTEYSGWCFSTLH